MRSTMSEMKIHVFGCSHHTAPVSVREQITFGPTKVEVALSELRRKISRGGVGAALHVQSS